MSRNGRGTLLETDNSQYVGEWSADLKHGQGVMTYSNGDVYDGEWSRDQRSGGCHSQCLPSFAFPRLGDIVMRSDYLREVLQSVVISLECVC